MATDQGFLVNLTDAQKAGLLRRSALLTVQAGKRVTMSDLLRSAVDNIISSPLDDTTKEHKEVIKFTPTPEVAKALKRAHANSGKPYNAIVNELVIEALQVEVNP